MELDFQLANVDDRLISLEDFPEAKGFVIIFTCNHCPYAIAYEQRIIDLNNKYAPKGYPVIAINSNDPIQYPQDSFENMKRNAKEKRFTFPYLIDETQDIATNYGAERTPHAFLIKKIDDGKFEIVYKSAIDDNYQNSEQVKEKYLEDAINQLMEGKEVEVKETKPVGCTVKWKALAG